MQKFIVLAVLVAAVAAVDIPFDTCPGQPGPLSFNIPECSAYPCGLSVGDSVTMNIGIRVSGAVSRLPTTATVITPAGSAEYPLPNGDACYAISGGCPTAAGDYLVSFPVTLSGIPAGVPTTIRVNIADDAGNTVACGSVDTSFD